jgi:hypothetical protein
MTINEQLKKIVEEIRVTRYYKEYQNQKTDMECLGVAIAGYFDWDSRIVEAFCEAMTDANFHDLRDAVEREADKYFKRD